MTSRWFWGWLLSLSCCWSVADAHWPRGAWSEYQRPRRSGAGPSSSHTRPAATPRLSARMNMFYILFLPLWSSHPAACASSRCHLAHLWPRQTVEWASRILVPLRGKEDRLKDRSRDQPGEEERSTSFDPAGDHRRPPLPRRQHASRRRALRAGGPSRTEFSRPSDPSLPNRGAPRTICRGREPLPRRLACPSRVASQRTRHRIDQRQAWRLRSPDHPARVAPPVQSW